ncbi:hypothetical protein PR048_015771 [Dryococelus australis]|uniref:Uncharacterized protein n=1 Tax=Dryococelus australis TaxID=614101 RepID=A0ABQ9HHV8_9NEOP|nr:hypothetical protein PR048_015771 [Dryococelus australis]
MSVQGGRRVGRWRRGSYDEGQAGGRKRVTNHGYTGLTCLERRLVIKPRLKAAPRPGDKRHSRARHRRRQYKKKRQSKLSVTKRRVKGEGCGGGGMEVDPTKLNSSLPREVEASWGENKQANKNVYGIEMAWLFLWYERIRSLIERAKLWEQVLGLIGKCTLWNIRWATVAERLACSPPTKVIRVQYPLGHSGFLHVGIVPDDAVGRRVFSGISRSRHCFILASNTLIGSKDLDVKSRPNLSTLLCLKLYCRSSDDQSLEPRVFRGLTWQQSRLQTPLYTRYNAVCLLVTAIKWGRWTGLFNTSSHYCFLLITSSPADLPWRSRLVRHRSGVREALGSNPGQGMAEKTTCLKSTTPRNEFAKYSGLYQSQQLRSRPSLKVGMCSSPSRQAEQCTGCWRERDTKGGNEAARPGNGMKERRSWDKRQNRPVMTQQLSAGDGRYSRRQELSHTRSTAQALRFSAHSTTFFSRFMFMFPTNNNIFKKIGFDCVGDTAVCFA